MNTPKMIIFDYGGTILYEPDSDWLRPEFELFKHIVKNPHNKTPQEMFEFNGRIFNESQRARDDEFELHHFQMLKMKYEFWGIELDISWPEVEKILWDNVCPMTDKCLLPGVRQMLADLQARGIRTGVVSNMGWSGAALTRRINTLLPDNHFEFIITSSEYGYRKPNELLFQLALNKAGLKAEEVWFVGDTFKMDVIGAHNAGIFPVFYQGEPEDSNELRRKPITQQVDFDYATIKHWDELKKLL